MKRIYWRPSKVSRAAIVAVALVSLGGMAVVENSPSGKADPCRKEKLAAAQLTARAMDALKAERLRRGHPIDPEIDPARSGIVGSPMTPITSIAGHLGSKQNSVNPNFAAAVVDMLVRAGVRRGDCVAVGCSGSFPAMNLSVYAACETLGVEPIVVASAGASQYGANFPDFLWVDMERFLVDEGLLSTRAAAASMGGYEDRALGMTDEGRDLIREAIARNGLTLVYPENFTDAVERRMEIYRREAHGRPIRAYVNVGAGTVSTGRALGRKLYEPGLNLTPPPGAAEIDSVMSRFARTGTPVIHMVEINQLARRYGLPTHMTAVPEPTAVATPGATPYNRLLAAALLVAIVAAIRWGILSGGTYRLGRLLPRAAAPESAVPGDLPAVRPQPLELMV